MILAALERNPLFISAALPLRVFPPLFNRYEPGMTFGAHVDNAIRQVTGHAVPHPHRPVRHALPQPPGGLRRRRAGGRGHVRRARGEAAGRRPDPLSGHEPAPRDAGDARRAAGVVLLDPEHGARRRPADAALRPRHGDQPGQPGGARPSRAWSRSRAAITTCCAAGPTLRDPDGGRPGFRETTPASMLRRRSIAFLLDLRSLAAVAAPTSPRASRSSGGGIEAVAFCAFADLGLALAARRPGAQGASMRLSRSIRPWYARCGGRTPSAAYGPQWSVTRGSAIHGLTLGSIYAPPCRYRKASARS